MATLIQLAALAAIVTGCALTFPCGVTIIIGGILGFGAGLVKERLDIKRGS